MRGGCSRTGRWCSGFVMDSAGAYVYGPSLWKGAKFVIVCFSSQIGGLRVKPRRREEGSWEVLVGSPVVVLRSGQKFAIWFGLHGSEWGMMDPTGYGRLHIQRWAGGDEVSSNWNRSEGIFTIGLVSFASCLGQEFAPVVASLRSDGTSGLGRAAVWLWRCLGIGRKGRSSAAATGLLGRWWVVRVPRCRLQPGLGIWAWALSMGLLWATLSFILCRFILFPLVWLVVGISHHYRMVDGRLCPLRCFLCFMLFWFLWLRRLVYGNQIWTAWRGSNHVLIRMVPHASDLDTSLAHVVASLRSDMANRLWWTMARLRRSYVTVFSYFIYLVFLNTGGLCLGKRTSRAMFALVRRRVPCSVNWSQPPSSRSNFRVTGTSQWYLCRKIDGLSNLWLCMSGFFMELLLMHSLLNGVC